MTVDEVEKIVMTHKKMGQSTKGLYHYAFKSVKKVRQIWFETTFDVADWVNSMPENYSDRTVLQRFNLMMSAGNYLQRNMGRNLDGSHKFVNIMVDVDRPKLKHIERRIWTPEEIRSIMAGCRGKQDIALVNTLFESTCRIHELVGLCMRDFDATGFTCNKDKKTGQRHYTMDSRIIQFLASMVSSPDEPIFKSHRDGRPATVDILKHYIEHIVRRAGISGKKLGAHTFRHTGGSLIALKTGSALAVKAKLGHDKIDTSMGYIHQVEEQMAQKESPMAMLNVAPSEVNKPELAVVKYDGEVVVEAQDLTDQMFDVIPDSVRIRPALNSNDLRLVRSIMVEFARSFRGDSRIYASQELLKRMLRKVNGLSLSIRKACKA